MPTTPSWVGTWTLGKAEPPCSGLERLPSWAGKARLKFTKGEVWPLEHQPGCSSGRMRRPWAGTGEQGRAQPTRQRGAEAAAERLETPWDKEPVAKPRGDGYEGRLGTLRWDTRETFHVENKQALG